LGDDHAERGTPDGDDRGTGAVPSCKKITPLPPPRQDWVFIGGSCLCCRTDGSCSCGGEWVGPDDPIFGWIARSYRKPPR